MKAIVALVLLVLIGLAVVAIALPNSDETASTVHLVIPVLPDSDVPAIIPQVITDRFAVHDPDQSFRKIWVRGCVASGESRAFCRCAITEYTTRLQPWEIETMHAVAWSGGQLAELPEHVREVVTDVERGCR
jgi:hypothetical protein